MGSKAYYRRDKAHDHSSGKNRKLSSPRRRKGEERTEVALKHFTA